MAPAASAPAPASAVPATVAPLSQAELARLSDAELMHEAAATSRALASLAGRLALVSAELDRREGWRAEGATSLESWLVERCGVSAPTARSYAKVGEALFDLPHLAAALCAGITQLRQGARRGGHRQPRARRRAGRGGQGRLGPRALRTSPLEPWAWRIRRPGRPRHPIGPLQRHLADAECPAARGVLYRRAHPPRDEGPCL